MKCATFPPPSAAAVVQQGLVAGGLSLLMTFLFVLIYYRVSGFIAIIGLVVNTIILFGVMAMFGFTFTLPGIAGMVLTIGMAVDANVLIYERLREEIDGGKSLKNAIEASYDRAFSAIFDSHVTSLITAVILFRLGSGTIKGFAVTLTIGVTASLFSAILVTRVHLPLGHRLGWFKKLTFLHLIKSANYDFMGKRRICIGFALATIVASLAAFGIRGERALGIDFTGGTRIMFQLGKETKIPAGRCGQGARRDQSSPRRPIRSRKPTPPPAPCSPSAAPPRTRKLIIDETARIHSRARRRKSPTPRTTPSTPARKRSPRSSAARS